MITIIRHTRKRRRPTIVPSAIAFVIQLALLLVCTCTTSVVQALPEGFVSEIVNPRTKAVTGVFAPNVRRKDHRPMMIVVSKPGRVRVLENPENLDDNENDEDSEGDSYTNKEDDDSNVILDLSGDKANMICDNGERGLTSIAVHPDFLETRWVYLYYTRWREGCKEDAVSGPQNVLVRYTMNTTTLLLENEELLLECGFLAGRVHNGGAMVFGTDGYLYLATGDGSNKASVQDRTNLHGSLLRLNDDGSVPDSNPYAKKGNGVPCGKSNGIVVVPPLETNENEIDAGFIAVANGEENDADIYCSEIYSWGFRNPIRMALNHKKSDKNNVLFSISDVGAQQFEELSWAGTDFQEKNYGWPFMEGPCVPNTIDDCPLPSSFDSNVVDPFHYYVHDSYENGGCVAGSAFVPEGVNWPEEYKHLFMDFILLKIYNLVEDPDAECRESCSPPTSRYINTTFYESIQEEGKNINGARMIDMFFGPYKDTQALYVIKYGNNNSILRIRYIGNVYPNILAVTDAPQESMPIDGITTPTESPSMVEPVPNSTLSNETNADSQPNPTIPDMTSSLGGDIKLSLESGNTKLDNGSKKEDNNATFGLRPWGRWLIGICITFLLIAPFYLGWKYYQLKHKLDTDSINSSSSKEFQDRTSVPKNIEATKEYTSTGNGDSVRTNVSLSTSNVSSSTSSASFSSSNVYSNRSAAIWEKIAEATERRSKLRSKYSSGIAVATTTPGTPETMETRESPSNLDSALSPSSDISTNIDETLLRLDDLLAKFVTKKEARNARKQERKNFFSSMDDSCEINDTESGLSHVDVKEISENPDKKSMPGSSLREKNDDSLVEATFSMASLYSAGSLEDNSSESQVINLREGSNTSLNLPEVSNTSVQSLLIFQDNDLSMSCRGRSINESDRHDDLMESGLVGNGDNRTTTSDLVGIDESY